MAYEYDPFTGRNAPGPENKVRPAGKSTPWLLLAGVVVAILALLFIFGGTGDQTPATTGAPATGGEVAPMGTAPATAGTGTAPATGGELAPAQPDAAPAPAAPID